MTTFCGIKHEDLVKTFTDPSGGGLSLEEAEKVIAAMHASTAAAFPGISRLQRKNLDGWRKKQP